jgi:hypothetical protein
MMSTERPARSLRRMNLRIVDPIAVDGAYFAVRGFDPFRVAASTSWTEATDEPVQRVDGSPAAG